MAHEITSLDEVKTALKSARVVAVLGAHPDSWRPASYVPAYLHDVGYRIIPVNPQFAGQALWGETVRATLREIREPVDIVDVFRRPDQLPAHLEDLLAMDPLPRVVWLQPGIEHDEVARTLVEHGIDVVQDRCTLQDHRRLGITLGA
jgi:uncharacterized protein